MIIVKNFDNFIDAFDVFDRYNKKNKNPELAMHKYEEIKNGKKKLKITYIVTFRKENKNAMH